MKTSIKLLGGLLLLLSLGACEKDGIESEDSSLNPADARVVQNYNNGMINQYSSETVIRWNELLSQYLDQQLGQPIESKIYAMFALAIHDALNNVVPKYETYALDNLDVDASDITKNNISFIADAAISQAARDIIAELYPSATAAADELLSTTLQSIPDSGLKERGVNIGKAAAAAMIEKRKDDLPLIFTSYPESDQAGVYRSDFMPFMIASPPFWPDRAAFGVDMGSMEPFGILSGDQFREETPYALASQDYIDDYNEVKALGCTTCPARTEEQTEIGAFWIESTPSSMDRMARTFIETKKMNGWEAARLIGLIEMSQIDAYIASFDGKYYYKFWRPVSAIHSADSDGVEATSGDLNWTSNFFTPPTPDFPSTHAYCGGAAAAVFRSYFNNDHVNIEVSSPYYLPETTRQLNSFSQMAYEIAVSRIYIGYHFRHSVEVGKRQGEELGEYVFKNNLRELKKVF